MLIILTSRTANPAGVILPALTGKSKAQGKNGSVWWNIAAVVLLAGTATILLASPAFPSEDGPVHLYYVDVLHDVIAHRAPYSQYFQLKTLLTPYALEYYSLLALETVFSPLVSEKLLIGLYILLFGVGFHCLVEAVSGERRNPWTLLGIPFCMNMLVYLGFLNYCLGIALMLLMAGLWIRYSVELTPRRVAALLAGFVLILLAHPIALAVFLLLIGLHFVVDFALAPSAWMQALRDRRLPLALIVIMTVISLGWVRLFVDAASRPSLLPNYATRLGFVYALLTELSLIEVAPLTMAIYRDCLILLLVIAGLMLALRPWKQDGRIRTGAVVLSILSVVCFLLFCFAPAKINGTWYFPERFPILGVLFLIGAAAAMRPTCRWSKTAGVLAIVVTAITIPMQWYAVSEIGGELKPALEAPPVRAGLTGLVIEPPKLYPPGLSFDPYSWGGVHYFRRSKAILANNPWMDQTHIMLRPNRASQWSYLDGDSAGVHMAEELKAGRAAPELDFVVQAGPDAPELSQLVRRLGLRDFPEESKFLRLFRRQE